MKQVYTVAEFCVYEKRTSLSQPLILLPLVVVQLYRLCWALRNNTEERIDLELDDWTDEQDSNMETEGTSESHQIHNH